MRQERLLVRIYSAAYHFAHISRDANEIAEKFGVSVDTVWNWAKTPEWEFALSVFNDTGDRSFLRRPRRDTQRDAGEVFEKAREAYFSALRKGVPVRNIATLVAKGLGLKRQRVYLWAKEYGWREGIHRDRHVTIDTEENNERDKTAKQ